GRELTLLGAPSNPRFAAANQSVRNRPGGAVMVAARCRRKRQFPGIERGKSLKFPCYETRHNSFRRTSEIDCSHVGDRYLVQAWPLRESVSPARPPEDPAPIEARTSGPATRRLPPSRKSGPAGGTDVIRPIRYNGRTCG